MHIGSPSVSNPTADVPTVPSSRDIIIGGLPAPLMNSSLGERIQVPQVPRVSYCKADTPANHLNTGLALNAPLFRKLI